MEKQEADKKKQQEQNERSKAKAKADQLCAAHFKPLLEKLESKKEKKKKQPITSPAKELLSCFPNKDGVDTKAELREVRKWKKALMTRQRHRFEKNDDNAKQLTHLRFLQG